MAETRYRGHWWLPSAPESKLPGTLCHEDTGRLTLELIGGFNIEVLTPLSDNSWNVGFDGEFPVILGLGGGSEWTLVQCHASHTSGGMFGAEPAEQEVSVTIGLKGTHLESPDAPVFSGIELQLPHLLEWTRLTAAHSQMTFKEGEGWNGSQTATFEPVENVHASYGNLTITLVLNYNLFSKEMDAGSPRREIRASEWTELQVNSDAPTSFEDLDGFTKAMRDLLTLATFRATGIDARTLIRADAGKRVDVISRIINPELAKTSAMQMELAFTMQDMPFPEVLPKWLDLHLQIRDAANVLFGLKYIPAGYVGSRLLLVASAAESMHRLLRPGEPFSKDEFDVLRTTALAAFPGSGVEAKRRRKLLREQLQNSWNFVDRMKDLAQIPDKLGVSLLLVNVDKWASLLKDARNRHAHADSSKTKKALGGEQEFWLFEVTYRLLVLVLMAELGFSGKQQLSSVEQPSASHASYAFCAIFDA